ncbi:hypothetical protein NLI96_g2091 [Meripilus lineatus]|uniref:Transposase family Tnp2 protein n=1 Tax=Meripilus lineatus TaxID=2056292 RepID=A0AAD5YGW8_9APHY|nr:hypothetical protein NLI96_g2091 [Physisporinus lineatus]
MGINHANQPLPATVLDSEYIGEDTDWSQSHAQDAEPATTTVLTGDINVEDVLAGVASRGWTTTAVVEESNSDTDSDVDNDEDELEDIEYSELENSEYEGISILDKLAELIWEDVREKASDLSDTDMSYLRAFAFKIDEHLSEKAFAKLPYVFPSADIDSLKKIRTRITQLSGIEPSPFDCCVNTCCCFTGPNSALSTCSHCHEPRFDKQGKPRNQFIYLPVIPRLQGRFANPTLAKLMRYRGEEHIHIPGKITDVMDSGVYRNLLGKHVRVDDKTLPHTYFSDPRHLAMGLSTDGFCPFRRRKKTAWPLILFDYSLPPDIRFHLEHILLVGIIPGPKKPVDADSFLWPLVEEFLRLAVGVHTWDAYTDTFFQLCAFIILVFGDIPAISLLMRMKGHNGISPCRFCSIRGVRIPDDHRATTYYVPLDRSRHPDAQDSSTPRVYDPSNLPMRTHSQFLSQAREVQSAPTLTEENRLAQIYGIKGVPILSYLSSLSFPHSFPYDFMHLIWENVVKNLILLWTGNFKNLDEGNEDYALSPNVWKAIGEACNASGSSIPSAYGPRPFNVALDKVSWTADSRSFWFLFLAPVVLNQRFRRQRYYNHFVKLVSLINICLQFEITLEEVSQLRKGLIEWVQEFERIYYQYEPSRLSVCTLTIHGVLHIPDAVIYAGPVWTTWTFPMERFCGWLQPAIRSRRFPFASLNRYVIDHARLTHIKNKYDLKDALRLGPQRTDKGKVHLNYDTCALYPPYHKTITLPTSLQLKLINHLTLRYPQATSVAEIRSVLPSVVEEWGSIQVLPAGDRIYASSLSRRTGDTRDATHVRYELLVDANSRYHNRPVSLLKQTFYGQLQHVYAFELADTPGRIGQEQERPYIIVGVIRSCVIQRDHPSLDIHYYEKEGGLEVVDITSVQCLIGRVKEDKGWAIIDRSGSLSRAYYIEDGDDSNVV